MSKIRIYISSTYEDLKECRRAVYDELRRLGTDYEIICMEDYVAREERPVNMCTDDVKKALFYIGIFGMRYGYVPDDATNPDGLSITEMEYRQAAAQEYTETLCFVSSEEFHGPTEQDRKKLFGLMDLREKVTKEHSCRMFKNAHHLASEVFRTIQDAIKRRGGVAPLAQIQAEIGEGGASPLPPVETEQKVDIARLPGTGAKLFGRDEELKLLEEALENRQVHIVCIVADGGTGKSALVNKWIANIASEEPKYRGATSVFGWSFYSQERAQHEVSADAFVESIFQWYNKRDVPSNPREKGHQLAQLTKRAGTLLILDGLEAIQSSSGDNVGQVDEQSIQELVKELAAQNDGLCIISTRVPVLGLQNFVGNTVVEIHLDRISSAAGISLLRDLNVLGDEDELAKAVEEYQGNALQLTLLGNILSEFYRGKIRARRKLDPEIPAAARLMKTYEEFLGEGPELDILRILGLFNRRAPIAAIEKLCDGPPIPGMTANLSALSRIMWDQSITKLQRLQLIAVEEDEEEQDDDDFSLETHAVVRQHFQELVRYEHPEAWTEGNKRLFHYYRLLQEEEFPDTFEKMAPLFHAVAHACIAGLHQEAWDEVYWPRIRRKEDEYSVRILGAWSQDLATVGDFFERPWDRTVSGLDDMTIARAYTEAAFDLRGLGHLKQSIAPMRTGMKRHIDMEDWWSACDAAGNLSEVLTLSGDLEGAEDAARKSIALAMDALNAPVSGTDRKEALRTWALNIATLADVLHQKGSLAEAEAQFIEAEKIYIEADDSFPCLHALRGYHYCDLLLSLERYEESNERAERFRAIDERHGTGYGIGLAYLSQARALIEIQKTQNGNDFSEARRFLGMAHRELSKAGHAEMIVRQKLTSAELCTLEEDYESAHVELQEALATAVDGQMRLFEIDAELLEVELNIRTDNIDAAGEKYESAQRTIRELDYGRRKADIARCAEKLKGLTQS